MDVLKLFTRVIELCLLPSLSLSILSACLIRRCQFLLYSLPAACKINKQRFLKRIGNIDNIFKGLVFFTALMYCTEIKGVKVFFYKHTLSSAKSNNRSVRSESTYSNKLKKLPYADYAEFVTNLLRRM